MQQKPPIQEEPGSWRWNPITEVSIITAEAPGRSNTVGGEEVNLVRDIGFADAVLDALPDATAVLDRSGMIVAVNHTWRMFGVDNGGHPDKTGVGVNYLDLCERSARAGCLDAGVVAAGIRGVLSGQTIDSEMEYPCPSAAAGRWFLLRINPVSAPAQGAIISHMNITRRKRAEQDLVHEAAHDPLTGLANRTLFNSRLTAALTPRAGRRLRADVGLLYLDLDGFKAVNDTYGHSAGDEILLAIAFRLRQKVRPQDTIARLGGDEFAILAPRITEAGLANLATRITDRIAEPLVVHGNSICVPASVGTYLASPGDEAAASIAQADASMYAIKHERTALNRGCDD